ncbi:MAG: hypothetical protein H7222_17245 [Methylotenera sp.]|nr:hypothetical protein [Oligoflexia bacterium]
MRIVPKLMIAVLPLMVLGLPGLLLPPSMKTVQASDPATSKASLKIQDWRTSARRFTGESDQVRENSITLLRKDPELLPKLKRALGTQDHFLALDVISVLRLRPMFDPLVQYSEHDCTGYSYHVINSLLEARDQAQVIQVYQDRLENPKICPAAKLAILDSLGRMSFELQAQQIAKSLQHDDPEVRSATLYYLRSSILRLHRFHQVSFLETSIQDAAFQIRLQTLYLLSELPASTRKPHAREIRSVLQLCRTDTVPQVKALCMSLNRSFFPSTSVGTDAGRNRNGP